MPTRAARPCLVASCPAIATVGPFCVNHQGRLEDARRAREPLRRLYFSARWRALRQAMLAREPLCRTCAATDRPTPATQIDHVVPHRGDLRLFWDVTNLQPLCEPCHVAKTRQERKGSTG